MIEQEPQSADMCDCILEQITILLSAQEMRVGPGIFLVQGENAQRAEEVPRQGTICFREESLFGGVRSMTHRWKKDILLLEFFGRIV